MDVENLIKVINRCAVNVVTELGSGFLEAIYHKALIIELKEHGITDIKSEVPIQVYYKEQLIGEYKADLIVDNQIIIELKAVNQLDVIHEVQLVHYLTATKIDHGLLINFGGKRIEIKRKYRKFRSSIMAKKIS